MFIGFDYGTANCSVAVMRDGQPQLLKMENNSTLLPSMLCAPTREAVSEWLYRHHAVPATDDETQALLRRAMRYNREEDIEVGAGSVLFGLASLSHYIDDPEEVYFVKSPKSFLGANGLKPQQVALFEDLVCAMMLHIRHMAQTQLPESITQAVIGRPINFQGLGGDEANRQAQGILERAAKRAGFQDVVFQFEPVAAGLDYEATLQEEKRVLVVDIGGGTTDCSLLLMGPQWHQRADRASSLLGHSGCRVGGNDLDIALAFKHLMPLLGMGGETEKASHCRFCRGGTLSRSMMFPHRAISTAAPTVACSTSWFGTPAMRIKSRCCLKSGVSASVIVWYAARRRAKSPCPGSPISSPRCRLSAMSWRRLSVSRGWKPR